LPEAKVLTRAREGGDQAHAFSAFGHFR